MIRTLGRPACSMRPSCHTASSGAVRLAAPCRVSNRRSSCKLIAPASRRVRISKGMVEDLERRAIGDVDDEQSAGLKIEHAYMQPVVCRPPVKRDIEIGRMAVGQLAFAHIGFGCGV